MCIFDVHLIYSPNPCLFPTKFQFPLTRLTFLSIEKTDAIRRINYIVKKQRWIKGLKFRDFQNAIDLTISIGVEYESSI